MTDQVQLGPAGWSSSLGSWLRGIADDAASVLPSLGRVIESARRELEGAPSLGVLYVRLDHWGAARELLSFAEVGAVYDSLSSVAVDVLGRELRRADIPTDLGLLEEGFALILSAPRTGDPVKAADVQMVADRLSTALRDHLYTNLPSDIASRLSAEVGVGTIRRPEGENTVEDALIAALVEAEESARARQLEHVAERGGVLDRAVDQGGLQVAYQPIVSPATATVVGFDALPFAPPGFGMGLSDVVLDLALRLGKGHRIYDAYHEAAVAGAEGGVSGGDLLMLHVSASELLKSAVRVMAVLFGGKETPVTPGNVLFLVSAAEATRYFAPVEAAFRALSEMGFKLGVDLGADQPLALDRLRELRPDLVRVGGRRVRGVATDVDAFDLVLVLAKFADRNGIKILAADCRDHADVETLHRAGVGLMQGEYFAGPFAWPERENVRFT